MKKFELTSETKINVFGKKLFRIKALEIYDSYYRKSVFRCNE